MASEDMENQEVQKEEEGVSGPFLFSEYFSDDKDPGVPVVIEWSGRSIPLRIKHTLTLGERQRANKAAFEFKIGDDGKPILVKQDQAAYTTEIVLAGLLSWPFEYAPGRPVPITREIVDKLDGDLASAIASRILSRTKVSATALDPFEKKSDAAS